MATTPLSPATRAGAARSVVVPSPSSHSSLRPQAHRAPSLVAARLWLPPPASLATRCRPRTLAGVVRHGTWAPSDDSVQVSLLGAPSAPSTLSPHAQTLRDGVAAT